MRRGTRDIEVVSLGCHQGGRGMAPGLIQSLPVVTEPESVNPGFDAVVRYRYLSHCLNMENQNSRLI